MLSMFSLSALKVAHILQNPLYIYIYTYIKGFWGNWRGRFTKGQNGLNTNSNPASPSCQWEWERERERDYSVNQNVSIRDNQIIWFRCTYLAMAVVVVHKPCPPTRDLFTRVLSFCDICFHSCVPLCRLSALKHAATTTVQSPLTYCDICFASWHLSLPFFFVTFVSTYC